MGQNIEPVRRGGGQKIAPTTIIFTPDISTPHQVKVQKLFEGSSMPFSISLYSSDWNRHTTTPGKKNFSLFLIVLISSKLFLSLWIGCLMALFLSFRVPNTI